MDRQLERSREDNVESSSSSSFLYSPNRENNGSTRSLLRESTRTARQPLRRLEPAPDAVQSLRRLVNKSLTLNAPKARASGPKQPPPISQSRDAKVDFMGYEDASKQVVGYVFVEGDLGWGREWRETQAVTVTLGKKIWDWIDWMWMRRRNCKVCVKIIRALRTESASRTEWEAGREICKIPSLLASVRSCGLCAVLYGAMSPADQKRVDDHREFCSRPCVTTFVCIALWRGGEVDVSLQVRHNLGSYPLEVEVKLLRRSDFKPFECSGASVLRHLGYSTGSPQAWAASFNWHRECTRGHKDCRRPDPKYLPTRVIDVGKHVFSNPSLILGSELQPGTKYATLSHCWGHSTQSRLLQSNLSSFRKKLPWKELSKTFKEAFTVTRHLGIRYLWIDSLCIVQDSPEDWARESSAMSKVYSNGYCNIAATSSNYGSEGLFRARNPLAIRPTKIPLTWEDTKLGKRYWAVNTQLWQDNVESAPLNRRGWVCQERLLSPRTLHFGTDQLYWECRTQTCCEFYPTGLPYIVPGVSRTKSLFTKIESQMLDDLVDQEETVAYGYQLWSDIVEKYSHSTLTFQSDKLVAVAGLAAEIQRMVRDEYCAGLWKKHFLSHLLWRANPMERKRGDELVSGPNSLEYVAPSWSWASIQCPVEAVYYDPEFHYPVAEILDLQLNLVNKDDLFGALKDAAAQIRGRLAKATMVKRRKKLRLHFSPNSTNFLRWMPETPDSLQTSSWRISGSQSSNSRLGIYPNEGIFPNTTPRYTLYFLLIQMTMWSSYAGLILKRREEDNTVFERWGSFQTNSIEEPELFEQQFANFDEGCLREGLDFCEYPDGGFQYDVTIV